MLDAAQADVLSAARSGDGTAFGKLAEPYRRELMLHGYRMLGSLQDAEDLIQETMLRAWRRLETFQQHVSFRAWLYKIATNLCLDELSTRPRRTLPAMATRPEPGEQEKNRGEEFAWLEPLPNEWFDHANPETKAITRESVSLAFTVALQCLPPRQRAVLILSDVLDWKAAETAELLDLTVSAANSALHRARTTMNKQARRGQNEASALAETTRRLLAQYMSAWDAADVAKLVALLKDDAAFTMPPTPTWFQGKPAIARFFGGHIFEAGPGAWRLVPAWANGQPAFAIYARGERGQPLKAFCLQVLTVEASSGLIQEVLSFLDTTLFARFGLPTELIET